MKFAATEYFKIANEVTRALVRGSGVNAIPGGQTRVEGVLGMMGARPRDPSNPAQRADAAEKIRTLRGIGANQGAIHGVTEGATRQNPAAIGAAVGGTVQTFNQMHPPTPMTATAKPPLGPMVTPMNIGQTNVGYKIPKAG